ncbi:uncharacterized protein LOC107865155 [Capsicum annuum]|uniref:uncharacterized protein LOC107865155 n=1 Tax=Capsicum annuum TaxID=4072 RepID=UPI001FB192DD|nr:uncharacterized protein LOC107865155 [Capsicum annuum]
MARGRGRGSTGRGGKSAVRSNNDVTANVLTVPTSTIVTSQADVIGGQNNTNQVQPLIPQIRSTVQTSGDGSNYITPESSPNALNQINRTREDMTRGRGTGRGSIGRVGKSAARTNMPVHTTNMPTIPTPTVAPQTAGGVGAPTSNHGSMSPTTPNQTNPTIVVTSSQTNQVGEDISRSNTNGESNSSRSHVRTLVTITSTRLQLSKVCSNRIHESFKSELDHNGVNWKGVSCDIKDGYFGESKKHFYWDSSVTDVAVKKHWQNPKCVEKSKINAQNRHGGKEVAAGTPTGGPISIGEYRKRLATEMGRDPTPSELYLHVHTHGHDGKYFIDERSRIVYERFEEILREKTLSESVINQIEAYYQAAGGEKKRRVFGFGSKAKGYYDQTLCISCGNTSSPASHESVPAEDSDLDEFVKRLIPALKIQFFSYCH